MNGQLPTFTELLDQLSDLTVHSWFDYPHPNWQPANHQLQSGQWVKRHAPEALAHWADQVAEIANNWDRPGQARIINQAGQVAAQVAKTAQLSRTEQSNIIRNTVQDAAKTATELYERSHSPLRWNPDGPFLLDAEQYARLERAWRIIDFFRQAEHQTMTQLYAPYIGSINSDDH